MSDGGFCFYCRHAICECPDQDPEVAKVAAEIRALNGRVGERLMPVVLKTTESC
jgi:hypothetical protein